MWHVGEQRGTEAWRNIQAVYQLGHRLSQSTMVLEQLVALALDSMAAKCTPKLMHHCEFTPGEAREILRELQALKPPQGMAAAIGEGERIVYLDLLSRLATKQLDFQDLSKDASTSSAQPKGTKQARLDWRIAFREGNEWFDRLARIADLPREERVAKFALAEKDIFALRPHPLSMVTGFFSCRQRSEAISHILLMLYLPALSAAMEAEDRNHCWWQMRIAAGALAVYRSEQGTYPENLDQLLPDVLTAIPHDVYSGKALIYQRRGDGYLLYSVFKNGIDDGGDDFGGHIVDGEWVGPEGFVPWEKSDMVVRVPLPAFPQLTP
jgi:hypothetical protein